jgi:hypothetical protein
VAWTTQEAEAIMQTKAEMLAELKAMLRDVFKAREEGAAYARLARAHGYVDGYMRGLLETGTFTKEELLGVVADQRRDVYGPATTEAALTRVFRPAMPRRGAAASRGNPSSAVPQFQLFAAQNTDAPPVSPGWEHRSFRYCVLPSAVPTARTERAVGRSARR